MYCPKCGKENDDKQRFCRACGLGLQTISQAVASEMSAPRIEEAITQPAPQPQRRLQNPLVYGFFLLMLGLIVIGIGKRVIGEQLIADIGTFISVLGVAFLGYRGITLLGQSAGQTPRAEVSESKPTKELPAALPEGQPASVTEHTTRHFEPIHRRTK